MIRRLPLDVVRRVLAAPQTAVARRRARHLADVEDLTARWERAIVEVRDLRRFLHERDLLPAYITWWGARHPHPRPAPGPAVVEVVAAATDPTSRLDLADIGRAVEVLDARAAAHNDEPIREKR